ncbi:hypothetical protein [uncultured Tyzzerella sp.]|uniref:hypothetical protein n=1 Tax=uncultured Tyzzerella sp. TaxID=2321398 RepID=UPI002943AEBF|nr:hypothetical protein [uncultured Tyzzerella sp.]
MNKLSKRETTLIIILINLIGYYLLFNVIGLYISNMNKSKLEAYEELKAQQEILEIENIKNQVDTKNLENLTQKNNELKNQIFSTTNSENIHYFLSNVAQKSNIKISNIKISENNIKDNSEDIDEMSIEQTTMDTTETTENVDVMPTDILNSSYNIELEIVGKYKDKINFIKNIEKYKKTLAITDFSTMMEEDNLASKIKMIIYTVHKEEIDKEFVIK